MHLLQPTIFSPQPIRGIKMEKPIRFRRTVREVLRDYYSQKDIAGASSYFVAFIAAWFAIKIVVMLMVVR